MPQKRAELVSDDPVKHAARLLRVDEIHIYAAGRRHPGLHRVFRYFIERDSFYLAVRYVDDGEQMPRYRLSLTVGVRCEIYGLGFFRFCSEHIAEIGLFPDIDVFRGEAVLYIDSERALRQVSYVTDRCYDLVSFSEIVFERPGLAGGLNYNKI